MDDNFRAGFAKVAVGVYLLASLNQIDWADPSALYEAPDAPSPGVLQLAVASGTSTAYLSDEMIFRNAGISQISIVEQKGDVNPNIIGFIKGSGTIII